MIINLQSYREMKEQLRRPFLKRQREQYLEIFNKVFKYVMDFEGIYGITMYQDIYKKAEQMCLDAIRTPEDLSRIYKRISEEKAIMRAIERGLQCSK